MLLAYDLEDLFYIVYVLRRSSSNSSSRKGTIL